MRTVLGLHYGTCFSAPKYLLRPQGCPCHCARLTETGTQQAAGWQVRALICADMLLQAAVHCHASCLSGWLHSLQGIQHASASMSTGYLQAPCCTLCLPLMALFYAVQSTVHN